MPYSETPSGIQSETNCSVFLCRSGVLGKGCKRNLFNSPKLFKGHIPPFSLRCELELLRSFVHFSTAHFRAVLLKVLWPWAMWLVSFTSWSVGLVFQWSSLSSNSSQNPSEKQEIERLGPLSRNPSLPCPRPLIPPYPHDYKLDQHKQTSLLKESASQEK